MWPRAAAILMTLVCTDSCVLVCARSLDMETHRQGDKCIRTICAARFKGNSAFWRGLEIIFRHASLRILTFVFILLVARPRKNIVWGDSVLFYAKTHTCIRFCLSLLYLQRKKEKTKASKCFKCCFYVSCRITLLQALMN